MKSPAFRLYAADFDIDTNTWELEEIGFYLRLLLSQWVNGPLPNQPEKLSKIARCSIKKFNYLFPKVSHKFKSDGNGFLYNERMENERTKQTEYIEKQRYFGKKGADKRYKSSNDQR